MVQREAPLYVGGVKLVSSRVTSNGPDWEDLEATMRALEEFHSVGVEISITVLHQGTKGGLLARAVAVKKGSLSVGALPSVSRSLRIGCTEPRMVAARIFRLMYDLDRDCGQMWAQADLFRIA